MGVLWHSYPGIEPFNSITWQNCWQHRTCSGVLAYHKQKPVRTRKNQTSRANNQTAITSARAITVFSRYHCWLIIIFIKQQEYFHGPLVLDTVYLSMLMTQNMTFIHCCQLSHKLILITNKYKLLNGYFSQHGFSLSDDVYV